MKHHGGNKNTYPENALPKYKISTINTWLQELAVMRHLGQTCKTWHIHTENNIQWRKMNKCENGNYAKNFICAQKTAQGGKNAI